MALTDAATGDGPVERATAAMRELTDDGWVRARPTLVDRLTRALRPSAPVQGRHLFGPFTVRTAVVVARVRTALDRRGDLRTLRVVCDIDGDGRLTGVAVTVSARFGTRIPGMAPTVRADVARAVADTVGSAFLPAQVTVDLHVADVHLA